MVDRRCAITKVVRPAIRLASAFCTNISDSASSSEVASSENQDRRVLQNSPRNGDTLPLAAAEPRAALADDGVVAQRQFGDEIVRQRSLRGGDHRSLGTSGQAVADIVPNGIVKRMFSCVTMAICSRSERSVTSRMSVPSTRIAPEVTLMKAREQIYERGLARAAGTDEGDHFALARAQS